MAVLQWHKVYKFGQDELHRAPVVALIIHILFEYIVWWNHLLKLKSFEYAYLKKLTNLFKKATLLKPVTFSAQNLPYT